MPNDKRESIRSLPFPSVASAIGWDIAQFKRKGKDWVGPCAIHGSKTNQSCFRYSAEDGRFNCFSCSAKGKGAIDLAMLALKIGFLQAVEKLSDVSVQPQQKTVSAVTEDAKDAVLKPYTGSYHKYQVSCQWLEERIPDKEVREKYGVFCYNNPAKKSAYSGRIMIPVKDVEGLIWAYLGRSPRTDDEAKYLFPKEFPKSRFLFGAYELRQHLLSLGTGRSVYQHVFLVESPLCVLKYASLGFPAVSPFGWSISEEQIELLATLTKGCVYIPDANKRDEGCKHSLPAIAEKLWIRFPRLPDGIDDPEQMTKEQVLAL